MLLLYIFGLVAVFILAIFASVKLCRWRKKAAKQAKKTARFYDLLERAEQGDVQAQNDLVDNGWHHKGHAENTARLNANRQIVEARREERKIQREQEQIRHNWEHYGKPAMSAHAAWRKVAGDKEEPALFVAFVRAYCSAWVHGDIRTRLLKEFGLDYTEAESRLQRAVLERYEMLVSRMTDDQDALLELRRLIPETRKEYEDFSRAGVKPLEYPDGWNEAVARFIENPHVEDFVRGRDPEPGQLRLWGEEAWLGGDIVTAKLVLAYANYNDRYREELGDVLTDKLGMQVVEYHNSLAVKLA